jgi:lysophospholipase L1-like esterase
MDVELSAVTVDTRGMLAHVMMGRMVSWYVPAVGGAVGMVVLATGLVLALTGRFGERLGPAPSSVPAPRASGKGSLRIVAIGDSLTAGAGDGRTGGYPARLAELLRQRGRSPTVVNLAVPGAETADVLRRIESAPEARAELARADIIVASAGGNDLNHALRPQPDRPIRDPEAAAAEAASNLTALMRLLRALNPAAPVRFVGLYNPFDVLPSEEADARATLERWNDLIEQATDGFHDVVVVPVADLFYERPDRLAADRFHPGSRGHALIASRVLDSLPEADAR